MTVRCRGRFEADASIWSRRLPRCLAGFRGLPPDVVRAGRLPEAHFDFDAHV